MVRRAGASAWTLGRGCVMVTWQIWHPRRSTSSEIVNVQARRDGYGEDWGYDGIKGVDVRG